MNFQNLKECLCVCEVSWILGDKTMEEKLVYISNVDEQSLLKLLAKKFGQPVKIEEACLSTLGTSIA